MLSFYYYCSLEFRLLTNVQERPRGDRQDVPGHWQESPVYFELTRLDLTPARFYLFQYESTIVDVQKYRKLVSNMSFELNVLD